MEQTENAIKISEKFLLGDLLKMLVLEIKLMPVAWSMLPENKQQEVIDRITARVETAVKQTVGIIASGARQTMVGKLVKIAIKDEIQAQIDFSKADPTRHELMDAQGSEVLLIVGGAEQYLGGEKPKADPNQASLLDGGGN